MVGKKRKYDGNYPRRRNTPGKYAGGGSLLRAGGGPAVLFTCESGRESKVRREAMQLFEYYYQEEQDINTSKSDNGEAKVDDHQNLSLEDEIALLKDEETRKKRGLRYSSFSVCRDYDIKGTVLVQCNIPSCIPLKVFEANNVADDNNHTVAQGDEADSSKEQMNDSQEGEPNSKLNRKKIDSSFYRNLKWDPVQFVREILTNAADISIGQTKGDALSKPLPPSSRFITRCIPLQATCYTSLEEIAICAEPLVKALIFEKEENRDPEEGKAPVTTFSVAAKVRYCSNLKKMDVIDVIANMFEAPRFQVDLSNPDYTVVVEICKTVCGISVVEKSKELKNFNIQEIRNNALDKEELANES